MNGEELAVPCKEKRSRSYNGLDTAQRRKYNREFLNSHKDVLLKCLDRDVAQKLISLADGKHKDELPVDAPAPRSAHAAGLLPVLERIFELIRSFFSPAKEKSDVSDKVESVFGFGDVKPHVEYTIEYLMRMINATDLTGHKQLFRQSASLREVKILYNNLMAINMCIKKQRKTDGRVPDKALEIFSSMLGDFEVDAISSVFKVTLRSNCPLLPSTFRQTYMQIGKMENSAEKLVLIRVIVMLCIDQETRERLEAVFSFLYEQINREKSPLKFKNISVVFTPLFFIDKTFSVSDPNFKKPLTELCDFLEFFLRHGSEIFLVDDCEERPGEKIGPSSPE